MKVKKLLFLSIFFISSIVQAELIWEHTSTNFVTHPLQASKKLTFPFKNGGKKTITLLPPKSTCGCVSGTVLPSVVPPGGTGCVWVVFNMEKRVGPQQKSISISTKTNPKPFLLYLSTTIPKTYTVNPKRLTWKSTEKKTKKTFLLINQYPKPLPLLKATALRPGIKVELKTIRPGFKYHLLVTPTTPSKKTLFIPIKIEPRCPTNLSQTIYFYAYVLLQ